MNLRRVDDLSPADFLWLGVILTTGFWGILL